MVCVAAACSLEPNAVVPPGDADGMDAGSDAPDTGAPPDVCVPRAESCNEVDDDCDGTTDEGFDTSRDPLNCGACGTACTTEPENGAARCLDGACSPLCDEGFEDCNDREADGCEANLTSSATCEDCSTRCVGATPLCQAGVGCVSDCGGGTTLCGTSCVDTDSDVENCSGCGVSCPTRPNSVRVCDRRSCGFACDDGWDDCDGDEANGCETPLDDVATCGACSTDCSRPNAIGSCVDRACGLVCLDTFGDCDGDEANGCEETLTTLDDCGGCGVACDTTNATGDCSTGTCALTCDAGFDDCNMDVTDGCEADLANDAANCDGCGMACPAGEACAARGCYPSCGGSCARACDAADPCQCAGETCDFTCAASPCIVECVGDMTACDADDDGVDEVQATCTAGASCDFRFRNTSAVTGTCSGTGTTCDIDCRDTAACNIACEADAQCFLRCENSSSCQFSSCPSGAISCMDNEIVCNRACP